MNTRSKSWAAAFVLVIVVLGVGYYLYGQRRDSRIVDTGVVAIKQGEYQNALAILEPFARRGNQAAELNMGLAYAFGLGTPRDRSKAVELLRISTNDRSADMYLWIAESFRNGDGVVANPDEANAWYRIAADAGSEKARMKLAHDSPPPPP
jgi:TPR repeat protein